MHRCSGCADLLTEHHKSLKLLTQTYSKTHNKINTNKEIKKRTGRETFQRAHHIIADATSGPANKIIIISSFLLRLICCKFLIEYSPPHIVIISFIGPGSADCHIVSRRLKRQHWLQFFRLPSHNNIIFNTGGLTINCLSKDIFCSAILHLNNVLLQMINYTNSTPSPIFQAGLLKYMRFMECHHIKRTPRFTVIGFEPSLRPPKISLKYFLFRLRFLRLVLWYHGGAIGDLAQ